MNEESPTSDAQTTNVKKTLVVREDTLEWLIQYLVPYGWEVASVEYDNSTIPTTAFYMLTKE